MVEGIGRRTLLAAVGAAALWPRGAVAGDVTRLRVAGDRIFLAVTVNGHATEALLDSAAETSVLDTRFAAALGIGGGETVTAQGSGRATAEAQLARGVVLGAAGLVLRPAAVAIVDLADIARRLTHRPIDIVLGRELFDAARLAIDINGGTLAVVDRSAVPAGRRLALAGRRGVETIPVTIEGTSAQADFDLGNGGRMLVGRGFAAAHGLPGRRAVQSIGGGGIGGEALQTAFDLARVDIAGVGFTGVAAAIDANPTAADANVGVALLRHFRIVADFAERALWLDPR